MSIQTFQNEEVRNESAPSFTGAISHIGIVLSTVTLFILPVLLFIRSKYIITNERVVIKHKALTSSSSEIRIEDIQQLDVGSGLISGYVTVTSASGGFIQIPFKDPNSAANTIRQERRN